MGLKWEKNTEVIYTSVRDVEVMKFPRAEATGSTTENRRQRTESAPQEPQRRTCFPVQPFILIKELLPTYYMRLNWSKCGFVSGFLRSQIQRVIGIYVRFSFCFVAKVPAQLYQTDSQFPTFGARHWNDRKLLVVHPTPTYMEVLGRGKACSLGLHSHVDASVFHGSQQCTRIPPVNVVNH